MSSGVTSQNIIPWTFELWFCTWMLSINNYNIKSYASCIFCPPSNEGQTNYILTLLFSHYDDTETVLVLCIHQYYIIILYIIFQMFLFKEMFIFDSPNFGIGCTTTIKHGSAQPFCWQHKFSRCLYTMMSNREPWVWFQASQQISRSNCSQAKLTNSYPKSSHTDVLPYILWPFHGWKSCVWPSYPPRAPPSWRFAALESTLRYIITSSRLKLT